MEKTILVDLLLSSRTQCKLVSFSKQVCTRRPSSFNEKKSLFGVGPTLRNSQAAQEKMRNETIDYEHFFFA